MSVWEYDIKERTIQRIDAIHGQFSEIFPNEGIICDVPDSLIEQGIVYRDSIEEIESMYAQLKEGLKNGFRTAAYAQYEGGGAMG